MTGAARRSEPASARPDDSRLDARAEATDDRRPRRLLSLGAGLALVVAFVVTSAGAASRSATRWPRCGRRSCRSPKPRQLSTSSTAPPSTTFGHRRRRRLPDEPVQHRRRRAVPRRPPSPARSSPVRPGCPARSTSCSPSSSRWWPAASGPASRPTSRCERGVSEVISHDHAQRHRHRRRAVAAAQGLPPGSRAATPSAPRRSRSPRSLDGLRAHPGRHEPRLHADPARCPRRASSTGSCWARPGSASTCAPPAAVRECRRRQRRQGAPHGHDGDDHLRRARGPRRHAAALRPGLPVRHDVPGRPRLRRDRHRAARPQQPDRHRLRLAAVGLPRQQSNALQIRADVAPELVNIIQGVILFAVVIAYELIRRADLRLEQARVARELAAQSGPSHLGEGARA